MSRTPFTIRHRVFFVFIVYPQGDTLAIDGSGWVFQLLEGQRVDHGGDYDLLHEAVVREVSRLRDVSRSRIRSWGKGKGGRCIGFLVSGENVMFPVFRNDLALCSS